MSLQDYIDQVNHLKKEQETVLKMCHDKDKEIKQLKELNALNLEHWKEQGNELSTARANNWKSLHKLEKIKELKVDAGDNQSCFQFVKNVKEILKT